MITQMTVIRNNQEMTVDLDLDNAGELLVTSFDTGEEIELNEDETADAHWLIRSAVLDSISSNREAIADSLP